MNQLGFPILSTLLVLPVIGALIVLFIPNKQEKLIKSVTFATTLATLLLSLPLYFSFVTGEAGFQFEENIPWIPGLGINYHLGIDGISLFIVLLTTLLSAIAVLSSWTAIKDRVKAYMVLMLLMETAMLGVFVSLDLFLFYAFWEASLIPMAFLIGVWGSDKRIYAAVKFFMYTFVGSALMLVAAIYVYLQGGTSDLPALLDALSLSTNAQIWLFFAFALAFAIKVPLFPLHTWLPAAHVQAPTAGSVILAGVLLKMGTYGYLRFANPLFPQGMAFWGPLLSVLAIIGIIYAALVALVQEDVKSLVAYSSVAHMGYIMLGIFSGGLQGTSGAVMQMVNHGLSTGALFMLVGVLYEQRHTRLMSEYGGIFAKVPVFGAFFLISVLASVGLPGLNGFVGEFVILIGTFKVNAAYAAFATFGIILAAWYLLTAVRRVMFGPFNPANENLKDMNAREIIAALPLVIFFFVLGIFPNLIFDKVNPTTEALVNAIDSAQTTAIVER
ncbi:MAG TPA: NADH-quinone oxidoreductase subunit M [Chloroflexi bacterium]|nr:NADH-quinone oxidoreductase subunit M [Chloroflexota bacterium]